MRVGAPVLQEKRQCRQVKGPAIVSGEVLQQLFLMGLESRARTSVVEYQGVMRDPCFLALGAVQAWMGTGTSSTSALWPPLSRSWVDGGAVGGASRRREK